jgi:anti-sigma factor RsiW
MRDWASIGDEELHAFIDGELDNRRRAEIEQFASQNPELCERIAAFRSDKALMEQIYGGLIDRPLPKDWLARIEESTRKRRFPTFLPASAAIAATVVALLFGTIAYRQALPPGKDDIIAEALAARNNATVPRLIEPVDSNSISARDKELAAVLKLRVKAPDLANMGYRLTALQVYGGVPGGRAVELVYRDQKNDVFTLYLRHSTTAPRFDQFRMAGVRVCIWQDDVQGMVVAGKMSAAEMQRFAVAAYFGLTT